MTIFNAALFKKKIKAGNKTRSSRRKSGLLSYIPLIQSEPSPKSSCPHPSIRARVIPVWQTALPLCCVQNIQSQHLNAGHQTSLLVDALTVSSDQGSNGSQKGNAGRELPPDGQRWQQRGGDRASAAAQGRTEKADSAAERRWRRRGRYGE